MSQRPQGPDDLSDLPASASPEIRELIKAEYEDLVASLRSNEELGERRLDVLLTVIAAVTAALGLASGSFEGNQTTLVSVAMVAASLLLVFGLMTLRRVMVRNIATTNYMNGLRRIRAFFLKQNPDAAPLFTYPPQKKALKRKRESPKASSREDSTRWWTLGNAGLLETVAAINCALTGLVVGGAAWLVGAAVIASLVAGLVAAIGAWMAQMRWTDKTYESLRNRNDERRQKVLEYWGEQTPTSASYEKNRFRAGVGLAIMDQEGRVLVFERSDIADSWQMPQGGIEPEEDAEMAAWRELREETGLGPEQVTLERAANVWVGYELPEEMRSEKTGRGQVHRWFLFRVRPGIELPPLLEGPAREFKDRQWMTIEQLLEKVVEFRRPAYELIAEGLLRPPPL
jgi:putative (di)nucleoside polyphosphate hydrolase